LNCNDDGSVRIKDFNSPLIGDQRIQRDLNP